MHTKTLWKTIHWFYHTLSSFLKLKKMYFQFSDFQPKKLFFQIFLTHFIKFKFDSFSCFLFFNRNQHILTQTYFNRFSQPFELAS